MGIINKIWKRITHTNAIDQSSGELEIAFFGDVYRVAYAAGLSTSENTLLYSIYSTVVKLMIAMMMCAEIWYVCSQAMNLDEFAACVNSIGIQIITLYKTKMMICNKNFYQKLARSMKTSYFDLTTEKRTQIMQYWAKTHKRYVNLLLWLGSCAVATWLLFPLVDEVEYNLMLGLRLPFRFDSPLRYAFTYLIVGITFIYLSYFVMVTDLVMQAHLVPLICQLSVLADCFQNIVQDCVVVTDALRGDLTLNNDFIREYQRRLGNLVEQHKLILNYSVDFKLILSGPLLGQLVASGTLMCFVSYQAATSLNISNAVYSSGWEQSGIVMLPGVRSTILLVIARATKPMVFTAGGMYDLSLESFTTLVKTSYSALTVVLRFRHE